jgi:hypothetical protein
MGICRACHKEMESPDVTTCEARTVVEYPDGTNLPVFPYDPKKLHLPPWYRCPDCNVAPGGKHHFNCDQECCPKCGDQLISCACFDSE